MALKVSTERLLHLAGFLVLNALNSHHADSHVPLWLVECVHPLQRLPQRLHIRPRLVFMLSLLLAHQRQTAHLFLTPI